MKVFSVAAVLLAGALWGTMGIFVRTLSAAGYSSMEIVAVRIWVTLISLGVYLLIGNRRKLKVRLKDLWCFFGAGIFSILFFSYCYFTTIQLTSLSVACILLYTAPAFVMVLSLFLFRETITLQKLMALVLAFAGCVMVTGLGAGISLNWQGVLLGLGSGFGYALYSIFGRYALDKGYDSVTVTFYTFAFASVGSLFLVDLPGMAVRLTENPETILWFLGAGLVTGSCAYLLYTFGLSKMESSKASILATVEPVVATLIGIFLFQETLTFWSGMGILLVLASLLLLNWKKRQHCKVCVEKENM